MPQPLRSRAAAAAALAAAVALSLTPAEAYTLSATPAALRPLATAARSPIRAVVAAAETEVQQSFVQTEMRGAAMKLHTRDQAREGQQPAQTPVQKWQPGKADYLQFLVDSRLVYGCFEEIVNSVDEFASFRDSGLERGAALDLDIEWFREEGLPTPEPGAQGREYEQFLREMVAEGRLRAFVCHFYNFYFAHTAGGRMIGKMMSDKLLDGYTLNFYRWTKGDVDKELLPALRSKIDAMAATWSREEKDECLDETARSFKFGGSLLQHISRPPA